MHHGFPGEEFKRTVNCRILLSTEDAHWHLKRLPEPAFPSPPESSIDTPKSLGIFDSSYAVTTTSDPIDPISQLIPVISCAGDRIPLSTPEIRTVRRLPRWDRSQPR